MTLEQHLAASHVSPEHFTLGKAREEHIEYEPRPKRWTRAEYDAVVETGILEGQHVELIEGEVLEMSPQGAEHSKSLSKVLEQLFLTFGNEKYYFRPQSPLAASADSEPEPDFAVVPRDDSIEDHPAHALLAVEISFSSVRFDRNRKARIYAQAGIEDYWIVNIKERQLEVYRKPSPEGYQEQIIFAQGESVSPVAAPHAAIQVKDLLP